MQIGNTKIQDIVEKFDTPLYVYDKQKIQTQCATLLQVVGDNFGENAKILYACKANTNIHILKVVKEAGIHGIDAVSPEEIKSALLAGFKPNDIFYTANYIRDNEIRETLDLGVNLNVGELESLQKLKNTGGKVIIRLNLDIGLGHHAHVKCGGNDSKFGIHIGLWKEQMLQAQEYVDIIGIHQHVGSKIMLKEEPEYLLSVKYLFQAAAELNLKNLQYIDIGGGFGVKYKENEEVGDLNNLFKKIRELYDHYFVTQKPILLIEPGRFIVAESGFLITRVTAVNQNAGRIFVGTDTGMNHLIRPALYESYHHITNVNPGQSEKRLVSVCGNICESGDILGTDRELDAKQGDLLAIHTAGAYGFSMSSNYNTRGRPAEVLVDNDGYKLIRRRETFEDQILLQNL